MLQSVGDDWLTVKSKVAFVPQLPRALVRPPAQQPQLCGRDLWGAQGSPTRSWSTGSSPAYGLQDYENAQWDEISGGYKIPVRARAGAGGAAKLLLLDEPLAYLDVITRQRFLIDLRAIASSLENPIPIVVTSRHLRSSHRRPARHPWTTANARSPAGSRILPRTPRVSSSRSRCGRVDVVECALLQGSGAIEASSWCCRTERRTKRFVRGAAPARSAMSFIPTGTSARSTRDTAVCRDPGARGRPRQALQRRRPANSACESRVPGRSAII